ncbi:MAG: VWA domain-containing protein [Terracidiphilus sp.]|jgi:VWFA-related protein
MEFAWRSLLTFGTCLAVVSLTPAQEAQSAPPSQQSIHLIVTVTAKSGAAVSDLTQQDFTILDNKAAQPITSFKMVTPAQERVGVILCLDEVNADYSTAVMQRDGVTRFLRSNGGTLPYPTAVEILTDRGAQVVQDFSTDGTLAANALAHSTVDRREIDRGTSFGDFDRVRISLVALHRITQLAPTLPGRKIVLWISPGWPLLSGRNFPIDTKMQQELFQEILYFSTQLRLANVTLYNINAVAVQQMHESAYYEGFVKGVSKPSEILVGNIGLQVLAVQSGGQVVESSTDAAVMIQKCLADLGTWYEVTIQSAPPDRPNEYHHIEVKVEKKGLIVRTREGYYSNPIFDPQR